MFVDEASAAAGTDEKKSSSKNKKKAAEKKAKGGVDAKTVCIAKSQRSALLSDHHVKLFFVVKFNERIST